jgi:hypothetical protein
MNYNEMEESSYGAFQGFIMAMHERLRKWVKSLRQTNSRMSEPVTSQIQTTRTNNSP